MLELTQIHKLTSELERERIRNSGVALNEGQNRILGTPCQRNGSRPVFFPSMSQVCC
jgi:hypothetical protein